MTRRDTLLIVDDNTHEAVAIASNVQQQAREHNLSLLTFTDGDETLQAIKNETNISIRAAIVDLWMVDKNTNRDTPNKGQEVIRAILKHHPRARVVVLSAHMNEHDMAALRSQFREQFRDEQMRVFTKPSKPSEILDVVLKKT